jgi:hypothetical protein
VNGTPQYCQPTAVESACKKFNQVEKYNQAGKPTVRCESHFRSPRSCTNHDLKLPYRHTETAEFQQDLTGPVPFEKAKITLQIQELGPHAPPA